MCKLFFAMFLLVSTSMAQTAISDGRTKFEVISPRTVATISSAVSAGYLDKIETGRLASQASNSNKVRVAVIDSGTCPTLAGKTNSNISKSFVGYNPLADKNGHGCIVSTIVDSINKSVEFVSLQVTGADNKGTLEDLESALEAISNWPETETFVVNMSLQNYGPSEKVKSLMQNKRNALFVLIAGNNGTSTPNFPGFYSTELTNVITVASAETNDVMSSYSGYGEWTHIAGFGSLPSGLAGTSYAAPQVTGVASLLLQVDPTLTPSVLKKIILAGGKTQDKLIPYIGYNPLNGRELNGDGSLDILKKMKDMEVFTTKTSYLLGEIAELTSSEVCLSQILSRAEITIVGNEHTLPMFVENGRIIFPTPQTEGEFIGQIIMDGYKIGKEFPIRVSAPAPMSLVVHSDGTPVNDESPVELGETFYVYTKLAGEPFAWILTDMENEIWWQIQTTTATKSEQFTDWTMIPVTLTGLESPLPEKSGQTVLQILVGDQYLEQILIAIK